MAYARESLPILAQTLNLDRYEGLETKIFSPTRLLNMAALLSEEPLVYCDWKSFLVHIATLGQSL